MSKSRPTRQQALGHSSTYPYHERSGFQPGDSRKWLIGKGDISKGAGDASLDAGVWEASGEKCTASAISIASFQGIMLERQEPEHRHMSIITFDLPPIQEEFDEGDVRTMDVGREAVRIGHKQISAPCVPGRSPMVARRRHSRPRPARMNSLNAARCSWTR
jgi:hypothetical protein